MGEILSGESNQQAQPGNPPLRDIDCWITNKCQLTCTHCYAESSPHGTHGQMTDADWQRAIAQGAALGVDRFQFIGGEATLHPGLVNLARYALRWGMSVDVFSNLLYVKPEHWKLFETPGVTVGTSFYSSDPTEHARITRGSIHSYRRTKDNIAEAVKRGVQLRASVVRVEHGQRTAEARDLLKAMGVPIIRHADMRQVGRGIRDLVEPNVRQLCGRCTNGQVAILPSGEVLPCVFAGWLGSVGNVRDQSLATILAGKAMARTTAMLREAFSKRSRSEEACEPDACAPANCHVEMKPSI